MTALVACFLHATAAIAAESNDFIILDESLYNREIEAVSADFIVESAIVPEDTISEYVELIIPICGDNIKDPGEICDGGDFGGRTCKTEGYVSGNLTCSTDCQTITLQACSFGSGGSSGGSGGGVSNAGSADDTVGDDNDQSDDAPKPGTSTLLPESTRLPTSTPQPKVTPNIPQGISSPTATLQATPQTTQSPQSPVPRPSLRPQTPEPVNTPVRTPQPTPTPAFFREFGPQAQRDPIFTNDNTPLIAGNMGTEAETGFVQVIDEDGNIVYQGEVVPNQNGAFIYTPNQAFADGEYEVMVYDITVPNAEPLWEQKVVVESRRSGTATPQSVDRSTMNTSDLISRAVRAIQQQTGNQFADTVTRMTGLNVEQNTADATVTDENGGILVSTEEEIDFGQVEGENKTVITGKTQPFGKVIAYIERRADNIQTLVADVSGQSAELDTNLVPDTVTHISIEGQNSPLIPLDRPINLGTIGRLADETVVIKGRAKPGAKVIIYFEKQAPPQSLFDYGASLLYDPVLDAYYYEATADENGIFEIPIPSEMPEGDYVVKTAIVEIDEIGDRIVLGEDREFAFSLFAAPEVDNRVQVNTYQSFMTNVDDPHQTYLWFPITIGTLLLIFFTFYSVKKSVRLNRRHLQKTKSGKQKNSKS